MPRKRIHAPYTPHPHRYVLGAVAFALALAVYLPQTPLQAAQIGIVRQASRMMSSLLPPKGATRMIDVPFHRQEHALSCEIASLRSALLAVGFDVPEEILLSALPVDETKKAVAADGSLVWGDPSAAFVGNIDGKMPSSGYGVHAGGLSRVAVLYSAAIPVKVDDTIMLVDSINRGFPIIAWSALGKNPRKTSWKTSEGKEVSAALYEHTIVVAGYRGTPEHMEAVYVVDPLTGLREESWDEFHWRTSFLDYQGLQIQPVRW